MRRLTALTGRMAVAALALALLTACGGGKDAAPTPTTFATQQTVPATLGSTVSDGVCVASVPDDWTDDGTGNGSTPSGARYKLFGGKIADDAAWKQAVDLVKADGATWPNSIVTEEGTRVSIAYPDGRGFHLRVRLSDRYCDFAVTSANTVPEAEQAIWPAIQSSLAAVLP